MTAVDWFKLVGLTLALAAVLAWGGYNVWLDIQWKRALIERGCPEGFKR